MCVGTKVMVCRLFFFFLGHLTPLVPNEYFCNLDMNGRRLDFENRPELQFGTVDFVATKEYCARPPLPASYVFAIDVSFASIQSGMLWSCTRAIKYLLYQTAQSLPPNTKIGIITYNRSIHFYNLKSGLEQAQMMVVPDIDDVFVPLHEGFLVDPIESRAVIENLLDQLPKIHAESRIIESALGSACQAAHAAMVGFPF